jgi:S-adenosylmethionine hydrolase
LFTNDRLLMIVLFTDFGVCGPYVGQMKAVLLQRAPGVDTVDLFADAPAFDPQLSAYLLAAYVHEFPAQSVFLCVVDPGVGSEARKALIANIDNRWYVGPHNGLFNVVAMRAEDPQQARFWEITWRPAKLSNSFHGRDLFAPVAAGLSQGRMPECVPMPLSQCTDYSWPRDLPRVVYIDGFANAMTGMRAAHVAEQSLVFVNGHAFRRARTFSDVQPGEGLWYENANGLVEVAVNQGRAAEKYKIQLGEEVSIGT